MNRRLMEGSEAIAEAMVAAGCRFFSGYPMTPFTEVLEHMAKKLPPAGGVCMNAESELEAVDLVPMAFRLAADWRNPVLLFGDYYLAHTSRSVELPEPSPMPALADWALDGSSGGSGNAKLISSLGDAKQRHGVGYDISLHYRDCVEATQAMLEGVTPMVETGYLDGAEVVVVAFGTPARYVRAAVRELRHDGLPVGFVRPVTLVPFPTAAIAAAAENADAIAVYENNQGQMVDDVRLAVLGRAPVQFIGGLSLDSSGFGIAPDLDVAVLRARIEAVWRSAKEAA